MQENIILCLYQLPQTVFTTKEISLLFSKNNYQSLKDKLSYAVETKKIIRLRKGVYAKPVFNSLELANKIYQPSYISLETVLQKEGVIFQDYKTIFAVSYLTRKINVYGYSIQYRKINNYLLICKEGIEEKNNYYIATKERAFLDALFIYKDYHFDNLKVLDWEKIEKLKFFYRSKIFLRRLNQYYKIYKNQNV